MTLSLRHVTHRYGHVTVLEDVTFDIAQGGYAVVTGPSGAGKTTLLSLLGGLEPVQEGELTVGKWDLATITGDDLASYRRSTVGFVFQHFGLLPTLSAARNVELALMLAGTPRRERTKRVAELLDALGLGDRRDHRPHQLSGGERQRVAIARALANAPTVLLADEPTGNLDDESALMVMTLLESLQRTNNVTLVVVTHSALVASRAPQRIALRAGRLEPVS